MSITLDVNAFLNNNDICTQSGCNGGGAGGRDGGAAGGKNGVMDVDDIAMEKEMEINGNIFDEIEHLLKFNKNLEFPEPAKEETRNKAKKPEESKVKDTFSLDFLTPHTDDFLLASDTQSLLGEDSLLFSVEQDRLQPLSSRFMVPGIYKRIEGVDRTDSSKKHLPITNVYITDIEKTGRIIKETEFNRLYILKNYVAENAEATTASSVLEPAVNNDDAEIIAAPACKENEKKQEIIQAENIPKEWDALNRLAYDILKLTTRDHIVIDRKRNEIVKTQYGTNQKTIYRLRQPETLGLKPQDLNKINSKIKGFTANAKHKQRKSKKDHKPKDIVNKLTDNTTKCDDKTIKECNTLTITLNQTRTRSGRLVKTPQTSQKTIATVNEQSPPSPKESLTEILLDLKDASYQCSKVVATKDETPEPTAAESLPPTTDNVPPSSPPKRKVPPDAICPTCHKIFLGRRLQRHFAQHPDHIKVPITNPNNNNNNNYQSTQSINQPEEQVFNNLNESPNATGEDMSLFRFLVNKLQKSQQLNEDQKADLFLAELNDLVEQIQLRSSRLIRNTSGLHAVNQRCAKLLGIPEGQYALDLTAIEAPLEPEMQDNNHNHNHHTINSSLANHLNSRSLDYHNLSITLDDTLTDEAAQKLNLSAGGKLLPPSEESLLRAVGDLVQTDISKIKIQSNATCVNDSLPIQSRSGKSTSVVANLLPPHIDHVSDNAVEAVNMKETSPSVVNASENPLLDLSVDFFQFNN